MKTTKTANWTTAAASAALILGFCSTPARAAAIAVPDGTFTSPTNSGTVGGGLINPSGTNVAIGSTGPWTGTYGGALGLLLPPTVTINSNIAGGNAVLGGIVQNLGLGPVTDTNAYVSQVLTGTSYLSNETYTLTSIVNVGTNLLGATVLGNSGVGIGLTGNGLLIADTLNPSNILSLSLLSNNNYQLTLRFTTGAVAPTGDLGIRLFDTPSGLASANLFNSVTFSNVTLDASPAAAPEPATFAVMFGGLAAMVLGRRQLRLRKGRANA